MPVCVHLHSGYGLQYEEYVERTIVQLQSAQHQWEDLEDVDVSLQYNWLLFIYLLCRVFLKNKISLSMESVSLTFHRPERLLFFPANN